MRRRILLADGRIDEKTYKTFSDAIGGVRQHPRYRRAQEESRNLAGATIVDAAWTDYEFRLLLSGDRALQLGLDGGVVLLSITTGAPWASLSPQERDPLEVEYRAPDGCTVGRHTWDPTALVSRRLGRKVSGISAGTAFFYLYVEDMRILLFMRVREFSTGRSMLAWNESD